MKFSFKAFLALTVSVSAVFAGPLGIGLLGAKAATALALAGAAAQAVTKELAKKEVEQ